MSIHTHRDRSGYTSGMSFRRNQIDPSNQARITPSWRWVAVLFVSILLHWFALEWANGVIVVPNWHDEPAETVAVVQLEAPDLPTPVAAKPKPVHRTRPHRTAKAVSPPAVAAVPASEPTPNTALTPDA